MKMRRGLKAEILFSVEEVRKALEALTEAQYKRIRLVARWLAAGTTMEADELISKGVVSALSSRTCPRHVPVMTFLIGAIRSLASAEYKAMERAVVVPFPKRDADGIEIVSELADDEGLSPEAICLLSEQRKANSLMVRAVNDALKDDYDAQLLLAGWSEGLRGEELRELVGKDQAGVDYLAKRVRRTIKLFSRMGGRDDVEEIREAIRTDAVGRRHHRQRHNLSDQDLDTELKEFGLDPASESAGGRAAIFAGLKEFQKADLNAAKAELYRFKVRQKAALTTDELAAGRSVFDRMKVGDRDLSSKMMLAARKGEGLSERDVNGIAEDLADLLKLSKDGD